MNVISNHIFLYILFFVPSYSQPPSSLPNIGCKICMEPLPFGTIPWAVFNPSAIVCATSSNVISDNNPAALWAIGATVLITFPAASNPLLTAMVMFLWRRFCFI
jgi:hypothetical protein